MSCLQSDFIVSGCTLQSHEYASILVELLISNSSFLPGLTSLASWDFHVVDHFLELAWLHIGQLHVLTVKVHILFI